MLHLLRQSFATLSVALCSKSTNSFSIHPRILIGRFLLRQNASTPTSIENLTVQCNFVKKKIVLILTLSLSHWAEAFKIDILRTQIRKSLKSSTLLVCLSPGPAAVWLPPVGAGSTITWDLCNFREHRSNLHSSSFTLSHIRRMTIQFSFKEHLKKFPHHNKNSSYLKNAEQ